jgi:hypothetical protein
VNETLSRLREFGARSAVTHAIMAATFLGAVGSAVLLQGQLATLSFVAFVNFTAGMWVCQSIHSLGNSYTDDEYEGLSSLR